MPSLKKTLKIEKITPATPHSKERLKGAYSKIAKNFRQGKATIEKSEKTVKIVSGKKEKQVSLKSVLRRTRPYIPLHALHLLKEKTKLDRIPRQVQSVLPEFKHFNIRKGFASSSNKKIINLLNNNTSTARVYLPLKGIREIFTPERVRAWHSRGVSEKTLIEWSKDPELIKRILKGEKK